VLGALEVLPFETPADVAYGLVRTRLEQAGKPIGANDMLIAAQTIALGYTIITDNEKNLPGSRIFLTRIGCAKAERSLTVSVDFDVPPIFFPTKEPRLAPKKTGANLGHLRARGWRC